MRALHVVLVAAGAFSGAVAPAHASPPCAQFNVCQYMPNPYNNWPLMPTWELPGGHDLPGGDPTMCNPSSYHCYPAAPGSGY